MRARGALTVTTRGAPAIRAGRDSRIGTPYHPL